MTNVRYIKKDLIADLLAAERKISGCVANLEPDTKWNQIL